MRPQTTTAEKLTKARTQLLLGQPFFGTLGLKLKLVAGSLPTMATDGSRIVYNPGFVDQLKPAELEGTLAHEVLHCALGHQCRRGERDPGLWNEAADFAINPILIGNGFALPAGALIEPAIRELERGRDLRPVAAEKKRGKRGAEAKAAADECWRGDRYRSARDRRHCALESESRPISPASFGPARAGDG